ncbi:MAG: hypothetical protein Q9209_007127 [Squamulea sp. 1 TL-2023]
MKHHPQYSFLSFTLLHLATTVTSQGTISLTLATSNFETAASASIPFNTLFDASSLQPAVSIQVNSGTSISIAQDAITCQCFSDKAGKQALGEPFSNVFPGAELGAEPVEIGSIFCSDEEGMKKMMVGVEPAPPIATTQAPSVTKEEKQSSTAATSPIATSTGALNNNNSPTDRDKPTAFLRFALSTDPSDDSSTQMPVPIDSSIVPLRDDKPIFSVIVINQSGVEKSKSSELVCQAFADAKAQKPIAAGFRLEEERSLGGKLEAVGAVGCTMLGLGGFGGMIGLVGS